MPDYGIKMSKSGSDAERSAEENLTFNSEWEKLQIVQKGKIYVPDSGVYPGTSSVTVAHNLGYVPHFMVWYECNDFPGYRWHIKGYSRQACYGKIDSSALVITNVATFANISYPIMAYYVIFKEKIGE